MLHQLDCQALVSAILCPRCCKKKVTNQIILSEEMLKVLLLLCSKRTEEALKICSEREMPIRLVGLVRQFSLKERMMLTVYSESLRFIQGSMNRNLLNQRLADLTGSVHISHKRTAMQLQDLQLKLQQGPSSLFQHLGAANQMR